jgi:hypothetical protein
MSAPSASKLIFSRSGLLALLFFSIFSQSSYAQEFVVVDPVTRIRLQRVEEDASPAMRIVLPGQPASDPGILVLFPEHVTAREHGKTNPEHLYLYRPGTQGTRPIWRHNSQSLEYEMELTGGVRMIARATLEPDGIRYHYDFVNSSKVEYDTIQAVTDPRMMSPYFRDVRLERT